MEGGYHGADFGGYRGGMRDDRLLSRIGGLLRRAEGTDNPHEAEAFLTAAQRLATASSIDLAVAREHDPAARQRCAPISRQVAIGQAGKRGLKTYVQLFVQIGRANDLTCDVAGNSTYVIAYGFASDIDTTELLYASLVVQMVTASDAYLKSGEYKHQTAQQVVTRDFGPWRRRVVEEKALSPITARLNFHSAFAERIEELACSKCAMNSGAPPLPATTPTVRGCRARRRRRWPCVTKKSRSPTSTDGRPVPADAGGRAALRRAIRVRRAAPGLRRASSEDRRRCANSALCAGRWASRKWRETAGGRSSMRLNG